MSHASTHAGDGDETGDGQEATGGESITSDVKYVGSVHIRPNGASTSIATITRQALELSTFSEGDRISIHTTDSMMRLDEWAAGHPRLPSSFEWFDGGVRPVRSNGPSLALTLPHVSLESTPLSEEMVVYQYATPGTVYLVPKLDAQVAPMTLSSYLDELDAGVPYAMDVDETTD